MPKANAFCLGTPKSAAILVLGILACVVGPTRADDGKIDLSMTTGWRLVDEVEIYLRDRNLPAFRDHVQSRFTEKELGILLKSDDVACRRATLIALDAVGSFASNARIGEALKDRDSVVRALAGNTLWTIWFRADTARNNDHLLEIADLIRRNNLREAEREATRLIANAPEFAEAYNQRAIARFSLGRFDESADDCKRVIARNPYHFGAISGLVQCHLRRGQIPEAVETLRLGLKIQPFDDSLRRMIDDLEGGR